MIYFHLFTSFLSFPPTNIKQSQRPRLAPVMEPLPPRHTHPGVTSKPLLGLGALSVYARTRRHPQTRIIVEPLLWTKLQLELLQCTFSEPLHAPPTVMKLNYDDDSDRQRTFAYHMFGSRGYGNRATAVQCLISGPEVPLQYL